MDTSLVFQQIPASQLCSETLSQKHNEKEEVGGQKGGEEETFQDLSLVACICKPNTLQGSDRAITVAYIVSSREPGLYIIARLCLCKELCSERCLSPATLQI